LVQHYWCPTNNAGWRKWKDKSGWQEAPPTQQWDNFTKELKTRKLREAAGPDILRWGYTTKGQYTIKEGYYIQSQQINQIAQPLWKNIWAQKHWPKVQYFLWLLSHRRILTWENLQKRGMIGPSYCVFCQTDNETTEHLLNNCPLVQPIWRNLELLFRQTDKNNDSIVDTINNWRKGRYQCQVINRAWTLSLGFILWNIWKERNQRTFQDIAQPLLHIWQRTIDNIRETILAENWSEEDWQAVGIEAYILQQLNLKPQMLYKGLWKYKDPKSTTEEHWSPPQSGFIKLNYDGASKGNPGQAGAGGIFRTSQGTVCRFYALDLGHATNNEAELIAVKHGILIAIRERYHRIIVEGDSAMVTGIIQKLQQGTPWEKITQSWRTAALIEEVSQLLKQVQYLIPSHIKRKGNEAADFLANWGCQNLERSIDASPHQVIWDVELHSLQIIVNKDLQPPDRGEQLTTGIIRGRPTARHSPDN